MNEQMFFSPGIKAAQIKSNASNNTVQTADWSGLGDGIANAGSFVGDGIKKRQTNLEIADGQLEKGKKTTTKLDDRIAKATKQGKTAKAARLTGKQERRTVRDSERAKRITQRNVEQKAQTQKIQDRKNERFEKRRAGEDGIYGNEDDTVPVSNASMVIDKVGSLFRKDTSPIPMKMSAKQYNTQQKFSKIAKDV